MHVFEGNPKKIGVQYGSALAEKIRKNIRVLVHHEGAEALPHDDRAFQDWVKNQHATLERSFPWLLEEMHGVAEGAKVEFEDILLLNLRAWQYTLYSGTGCSSLLITLEDGTLAGATALDDPPDLYCGPVHFIPDKGHSFIAFPITGSSWGGHGMNNAGLFLGCSSLVLEGLRPMPDVLNQDLALRAILQTCASTSEVREFCREYPFSNSLACLDANGGIFCAHQTNAGLFEIPLRDGYHAFTNHVVDDRIRYLIYKRGATKFHEDATTWLRRGHILSFAHEYSGKCTAQEVKDFFARREEDDRVNVNNKGTLALFFACPEKAPKKLWMLLPDEEQTSYTEYTL
jgi:hypothetical protein